MCAKVCQGCVNMDMICVFTLFHLVKIDSNNSVDVGQQEKFYFVSRLEPHDL